MSQPRCALCGESNLVFDHVENLQDSGELGFSSMAFDVFVCRTKKGHCAEGDTWVFVRHRPKDPK